MKATELQIGDYVRISHRNKIGKVYRIDKANGEGNGYAAVLARLILKQKRLAIMVRY